MGAHTARGRRGGHHQAQRSRPGGPVALVALAALAVGSLGVVSVEATGAGPVPSPSPPPVASPGLGFPQPGPADEAPSLRAPQAPAQVGTEARLGPLGVVVTGIRLLDREGTTGSGVRVAVDLRITNASASEATSPWAELVCGRSVGSLDRQSTMPPGSAIRPQETTAGALVVGVPVADCPWPVLRIIGPASAQSPAPVLRYVVATGLA